MINCKYKKSTIHYKRELHFFLVFQQNKILEPEPFVAFLFLSMPEFLSTCAMTVLPV